MTRGRLVVMAHADALTVAEAADELGLDGASTYALIFGRRLAFEQAANGRILVPRAAVDRYRAQREPHQTSA